MNGPPRRCRLDGRSRSRAAVMARLARELGFPAHFGGNLDALYDVLTTDIAGPIEIVWRGRSRAALAADPELGPLLDTLEAAAKARPDLVLQIEEPGG